MIYFHPLLDLFFPATNSNYDDLGNGFYRLHFDVQVTPFSTWYDWRENVLGQFSFEAGPNPELFFAQICKNSNPPTTTTPATTTTTQAPTTTTEEPTVSPDVTTDGECESVSFDVQDWENLGVGYFNLKFSEEGQISNTYNKHDFIEVGFSKPTELLDLFFPNTMNDYDDLGNGFYRFRFDEQVTPFSVIPENNIGQFSFEAGAAPVAFFGQICKNPNPPTTTTTTEATTTAEPGCQASVSSF